MDWGALLNFFFSTTILSSLFAYLGKKIIESYLAGKLESHKKNLEKIALEHSIRFQNLHSERAVVIKEVYEKLVALDESLGTILRPVRPVDGQTLSEKVNQLAEIFNEFRDYFLLKRIFFEESTCELIDKILKSAKGIFYHITTFEIDPHGSIYKYAKDLLKERHEFWEQARGIHENEVLNLKKNLENEFRVILGIDT